MATAVTVTPLARRAGRSELRVGNWPHPRDTDAILSAFHRALMAAAQRETSFLEAFLSDLVPLLEAEWVSVLALDSSTGPLHLHHTAAAGGQARCAAAARGSDAREPA